MDFAERLYVLRAAKGDRALLALATVELVHSEQPMEEREAIKRALLAAAVPHWFDPPFLCALLAVEEPEAERLYGHLSALTAVEPFSARGERAVNVHESARLALREHLRQSNSEWWQTLAGRAREHVAASTSVHDRIEALHHFFAINQEAAAAECETLLRDFMNNPEWSQALAISLQEIAATGWLRGSALVEALLIPLQTRTQLGETAKLEPEACAVAELAESHPQSSRSARAQCLVGDVYTKQGRLDKALASFQKSLAINEQLVQGDPSNANWQHDLSVSHSRLGDVYKRQGRLDKALASFQKSLALVEQLVQGDPSNANWQHALGVSHSRLGDVYQRQDRLDKALASFQKSLAIDEQLVQGDPSNARWQHDLGASHSHLGALYERQGRFDKALASFQKSLSLVEQLVQGDPSNARWQHDLGVSYTNLGDVYQSQGRLDKALASFQKSLALVEQLVQGDPSNANWRRELDAIKVRLGKATKRRRSQQRAKGFFEAGERQGGRRKS